MANLSEYDVGTVVLDDREADKRERLVQTYIVLFGLLLSYNQVLLLQRIAMSFFILFLLSIMLYYSVLNTRPLMRLLIEYYGLRRVVYIVNFIAVSSIGGLSFVVVLFFLNVCISVGLFSPVGLFGFFGIGLCTLILASFLCMPLVITRDMFR